MIRETGVDYLTESMVKIMVEVMLVKVEIMVELTAKVMATFVEDKRRFIAWPTAETKEETPSKVIAVITVKSR